MNELAVELHILIALELPRSSLLNLACVSKGWNWVTNEVWRLLIPQETRKCISILFPPLIEEQLLGTSYLCRFMVVASKSRVLAFLLAQALQTHVDHLTFPEGLPKRMLEGTHAFGKELKKGKTLKYANLSVFAMMGNQLGEDKLRELFTSILTSIHEGNELHREKRDVLGAHSVTYGWDDQDDRAPKPQLHYHASYPTGKEYDEWPVPPIPRWPREILRVFQEIFEGNEKRHYYPRCCHMWTSEIRFHSLRGSDSPAFLVSLNQLAVLCAIDESEKGGVSWATLQNAVGLDDLPLEVTIESLEGILLKVDRTEGRSSVSFNSDWILNSGGEGIKSDNSGVINLASTQELMRLKHFQAKMKEIADEDVPLLRNPYDLSIECPRRKNFDIQSLWVIVKWSWDMGVDNCPICRNHIMDLCIDCQGNQLGEEENANGDECKVTWGECGHSYHTHCITRWTTQRGNVCPLDDRTWVALAIENKNAKRQRTCKLRADFKKTNYLHPVAVRNEKLQKQKERRERRTGYLIDDAIVRILKRRGVSLAVSEEELIQLVLNTFDSTPHSAYQSDYYEPPTVASVQRRFPSLIEREYMERINDGFSYRP